MLRLTWALALLVALLTAGSANAHQEGDTRARAFASADLELVAEEDGQADLLLPPVAEFDDPLERVNRVSFGLNRGIERVVVRPLTSAYGFVLPGPVRRGLRRALANLALPAVAANEILQLRPHHGGVTLSRLVVNTTVGLLGLFDPATRIGLASESTGFGDTLAFYRVPSGPYMVLPLLGPSRPRDAVGRVTDLFLRPDTYLLGPTGTVAVASGGAISERDAHGEAIRSLEASSVDIYSTYRGAYLMSRSDVSDSYAR
jgi:phospholipid-binding lipoprotein MlaA